MGLICVLEDLSRPEDVKAYSWGGTFMDWVVEHYPPPHAFGGRRGVVHRHDGRTPVPVEDWDFKVEEGEKVFLVLGPLGIDPVSIAVTIAINIAISLALTALSALLAPKPEAPRNVQAPKPSSVFSVSVPQNQARLTEAIPVLYGRLTTVPDLASQPYTYYDNNYQFAHILLCCGMGNIEIRDVLLGATSVNQFPAEIVDYRVYQPSDHGGVHGVIDADFGFHEDVITAPEVNAAELTPQVEQTQTEFAYTFQSANTIRIFTDNSPENGLTVGADLTLSGTPYDGTYEVSSVSTGTSSGIDYADVVFTTSPGAATSWSYATAADDVDSVSRAGAYIRISGTVTGGLPAAYSGAAVGDHVRVFQGAGDWVGIVRRRGSGVSGGSEVETTSSWYLDLEVYAGTPTIGASATFREALNVVGLTSEVEAWVGWFTLGKSGTIIEELELDFDWPAGLFQTATDGSLAEDSVTIRIQYQQVDSSGAPVAGTITNDDFTFTTSDVRSGQPINSPKRYTRHITVTPARYRVRVRRTSAASNDASDQSRTVWSQLKAKKQYSSATVYDGTTLIALKIRSTEGVAPEAFTRVRADLERRLPRFVTPFETLGGNLGKAPSRALHDLFVNPTYGLGLSQDYIDISSLRAFQNLHITNKTGEPLEFNHLFDTQQAAWEAAKIVCQSALCSPAIVNGKITMVQEGPKSTPTQMFSPSNIVRGSLRVRYAFRREGDPDGVRVVYRDRSTLAEEVAEYPSSATQFEEFDMYGLVNATVAADIALIRYRQQQTTALQVEFETELEGRIVNRGDLISLSWPLFSWGTDAAFVTAVNGRVLTLDRTVNESADWVQFRDENGQPVGPVAMTVTDQKQITLAADPPLTITPLHGLQEPTHLAVGESASFYRLLTVDEVSMSDTFRMRVRARGYSDDVWAGTEFETVVT